MMGGGMGGGMVLMPILGVLFWGAILWLIASTVRPGRRADRELDAIEIARRRFAAGEITRAELEHIRDDLHATS
jgi:uncharacterized membrane protein